MSTFTSADVFDSFDRDAFRFESRGSYVVGKEASDYARFLAGETLAPPPELPWFRAWLDRIRDMAAQGRTFTRVRLLADPPTDYQRWEMWSSSYNEAAGETVRFLGAARAVELGLPACRTGGCSTTPASPRSGSPMPGNRSAAP